MINNKNDIAIQLVEPDKLMIDLEEKDDEIKNFLLNIKGLENKNNEFTFSLKMHKEIINKISEKFPEIIIKDVPSFVFKSLTHIDSMLHINKNLKITYDKMDNKRKIDEISKSIRNKLFEFQKKGIEFAIQNSCRLLLADEMGIGKTVQALALSSIYQEAWPLLIICPSSLRLLWREEILKWMNDKVLSNSIQIIYKSNLPFLKTTKIFIFSYDLCSKYESQLSLLKPQIIIADEAHYLKNNQSQRSQFLLPLLQKSKFILLLTGTPALNKPKELFSLLHILRPDVFTNFKEFAMRYCDPKPNPWSMGLDFNGATNLKELNCILRSKYMIRRLKKDVLEELPEKNRQKVPINIDEKVLNQISMIRSEIDYKEIESVFEKEREDNISILKLINQCYILTGKAKIKGIKEYINQLIENDIKFIVYAFHIEVLDEIETEIKKKNIQYIRIDGRTSANTRFELTKNYQNNEKITVALLSLTSSSVGITLTEANHIVFAEIHWTPAIMLQAEDRAHRIGQKSSVNCHYLFGNGTLDEYIYKVLDKKINIINTIMDNKYEKPFNEENEILNRKMEIENNEDKQNKFLNNEINDNIELINNDKINKILQIDDLKDEDLENLELINELMNLWEREEKRKIEYPILKEEKNNRNINFSNQKHKNEKSHKKTFSKKEFYFIDEFDQELNEQRNDFQDSFEIEIGEKLSKKIKKNEIILID